MKHDSGNTTTDEQSRLMSALREPDAARSWTLIHKRRSFGQPNVYLCEIDSNNYVVKTYRDHWIMMRHLWGRWVSEKEYATLRRLKGIDGVPEVFGMPDQCSVVMEYIEGAPLSKKNPEAATKKVLEKIDLIVHTMHAQKVAHGDIRMKNILVTPDGETALIDFATAFHLKNERNPLARRFFEKLCLVDRIKVAGIKKTCCPESLSEEELRILSNVPFMMRAGSFLRRRVYKYLLPSKWARMRRRKQRLKNNPPR